jgi:uncharacterized caspase-like protein
MHRIIYLLLKSLSVILLMVVAIGRAEAATQSASDSGVFVEFRNSESPNALVVERWRLYGSSHALVIGIDDYSNGWPRLSNAVKDAQLVAKALEARGFDVQLLTNVNGAQLRESLRRFFAIKGADPNTRLFIWFAGHGYTRHGEGYLVPKDAPPPHVSDFLLSALHMGDVGSMVRIAASKHVLAVFDSCFAGTVFQTQRARPPAAITAAVKRPVRQFLTSGDADQQVSDDGTFRTLFLRAIAGEEAADANEDGYLTGTELSLFLEDRVVNLTLGAQTPRGGKLRDPRFDQGDFVFVLPQKESAVAAVPQTSPVTTEPAISSESGLALLEMTFWQTIQDSEKASDYQAYLRQYPDGAFTELARNRLLEFEQAQLDKGEQQAAVAVPEREELRIVPLNATYVAVRDANLRSGPSTSTTVTGRLARGQGLNVTGKVRDVNWFQIAQAGKGSAFVYGSLVAEIAPDELALWEVARESGEPSDYRAYVDRYPQGIFATEARALAPPVSRSPDPQPAQNVAIAETPATAQSSVPEEPSLPHTKTEEALTVTLPQAAALPADQFVGSWRGGGRLAAGSSRVKCGSGPIIELTVEDGEISGQIKLIVATKRGDTTISRYSGGFEDNGNFKASGGGAVIDGSFDDDGITVSGTWNLPDMACKGTYRLTRTEPSD